MRYVARQSDGVDSAMPTHGVCTVVMIGADGVVLADDIQRELVGGERSPLTITHGSVPPFASFSLKMHATSLGQKYRLAFDIEWVGVDGQMRTQRVKSDAFQVNTNVRRPRAKTRSKRGPKPKS